MSLNCLPDALFDRENRNNPNSNSANDGNWWEETDLLKIIIADNQLTCIDARLATTPFLQSLTFLDAHNNLLTSFLTNDTASLLSNLSILNLNGNKLTTLPEALFTLPLAELHLSSNQFTTFPIHLLPQTLIKLDLSHNQIQFFASSSSSSTSASLAASFPQLPLLSSLFLQSNHLSILPYFIRLPKLSVLNVSHNRLESMGLITDCPQLVEINASQNQLTQLFDDPPALSPNSSLIILPGLMKLDVRVNKLRYLMHPPDSNASLSNIHETINSHYAVQTCKLKELYLSSNKLTSLQGSLGLIETSLKAIETLDIRDNGMLFFLCFILFFFVNMTLTDFDVQIFQMCLSKCYICRCFLGCFWKEML